MGKELPRAVQLMSRMAYLRCELGRLANRWGPISAAMREAHARELNSIIDVMRDEFGYDEPSMPIRPTA